MNQLHQPQATTVRWSPRLLNDIVNAPDLATAAAHLGVNGIPVFPCVPCGKRPLTAHGFQDASAERDVIDFWWRRHPDANIGVPTGAAGGVDVVDVDVHKTVSGYPAFEHARRAGFVEGWAWLIRTPSGGLHAYFLHTGEREQRSWQVPGTRRSPSGTTSIAGSWCRTTALRRSGSLLGLSPPTIPKSGSESP